MTGTVREDVRLVLDGIYFGEGPRWREGRLWFSDFHAQTVNSVSLEGDARVELKIDDRPSGLGWMPDGSLLVVAMTQRKVLRRFPDGRLIEHADLSGLTGYHCNDMIVDRHGRAYVGEFGFDIDREILARGGESVAADHPPANLVMVDPGGTASIVASDMHFPNGMALSSDGQTLFVGETLGACLTAFSIEQNGRLTDRRLWAQTLPRVPDGISRDAEGAIWIANPLANECVRIAEGGEVLDTVITEQPSFACMLGGDNEDLLFILTAETSIYHEAAKAPKGQLVVAELKHR